MSPNLKARRDAARDEYFRAIEKLAGGAVLDDVYAETVTLAFDAGWLAATRDSLDQLAGALRSAGFDR